MKKIRLRSFGRREKFAVAISISVASFFIISFISAICSGFFENSRAGAEYLTLVTLLCSGVVSGFISEKILRSPASSALTVGIIAIAFAVICALVSGYSLGALMNHLTFLLPSFIGIFLAREKKHRRHKR